MRLKHNISGSDVFNPGALGPAHGALRLSPMRRTRSGWRYGLLMAAGAAALLFIAARSGLLP